MSRRLAPLWTLARRVPALLALVLCIAVTTLWWMAARDIGIQRAAWHVMERAVVPLEGAVVLGPRELGQRGGAEEGVERRHILIETEGDGTGRIANLSETRRLFMIYSGVRGLFARSVPVDEGRSLAVRIEGNALTLTRQGGTIRIEDGQGNVRVLDFGPEGCRGVRGETDESLVPVALLASLLPGGLPLPPRTLAVLGGNGERGGTGAWHDITVPSCRVPLAGTVPDLMRLRLRDGRVFLETGTARAATVSIDKQAEQVLSSMRWPLDDPGGIGTLERIVVGRTAYDVALAPEGKTLVLEPVSRVHRHAAPPEEVPGVTYRQGEAFSAVARIGEALAEVTAGWPGWVLAVLPGALVVLVWLGAAQPGARTPVILSPLYILPVALLLDAQVLADPARMMGPMMSAAGTAITVWIGFALFDAVRSAGWTPGSFMAERARQATRRDRAWLAGVLGWIVAVFALHDLRDGVPGGADVEATILLVGYASAVVMAGGVSTFGGIAVWCGFVVLVAFGTVALDNLSASIADTRWDALMETHLLAIRLTVLPALLVLLGTPHAIKRSQGWHRAGPFRRGGFVVLASLAIGVVAAFWLIFGGETGVFGIQPSELFKTFVIFALAHAAWVLWHRRRSRRERNDTLWILLPVAGVTGMVGFFLLVPVAQSDYSPALLIGMTVLLTAAAVALVGAAGLALAERNPDRRAYARSARRKREDALHEATLRLPANRMPGQWRKRRLGQIKRRNAVRALPELAGLAAILVLAFVALTPWTGWLVSKDGVPATVIEQRIASWQELRLSEGHVSLKMRDLSEQVIRSRMALREARCLRLSTGIGPVDGWMAMRSDCTGAMPRPALSPVDGTALRVPAVQDDFAVVAVAATYGLLPTIGVLLAGQGAVFVALLALAASMGRLALSNPALENGAVPLAVACFGFAVLLGSQWAISWGNAFGVLPVMGQPATWLSLGGSHGIFVGMPALATALAAARLQVIGR